MRTQVLPKAPQWSRAATGFRAIQKNAIISRFIRLDAPEPLARRHQGEGSDAKEFCRDLCFV
jgi:hypothetical protein